eukprot:1147151-Pelagomonas_calceolata.AAC.2
MALSSGQLDRLCLFASGLQRVWRCLHGGFGTPPGRLSRLKGHAGGLCRLPVSCTCADGMALLMLDNGHCLFLVVILAFTRAHVCAHTHLIPVQTACITLESAHKELPH